MRRPSVASSSTSKTPCCSKVGIKRGPWTPEEDEILANYIKRVGEGRWRTLPKHAGLLRCGKSCRLRWMNYLRPSVKRGQIAPDEEDLILRLHRLLGNRWALIAGRIPGRTDNEIKNYWNTHLSKKLINQGIDPRTHKPLIVDNPNPNPKSNRISSSSTTTLHFTPPSPNPNLNPNPNPNSSGCDPSKTISKETKLITHQLVDDQNKKDPMIPIGVDNSTENWQNCDGYCDYDDIFSSSFLNSWINEDDFGNQHHHQPHSTVAAASSSSMRLPPVMPSVHEITTFNHGNTTVWEAAGMAPTMATNLGNEQSGLNNHMGWP